MYNGCESSNEIEFVSMIFDIVIYVNSTSKSVVFNYGDDTLTRQRYENLY